MVKEGIQGRTAKIKGHLKGHMKTVEQNIYEDDLNEINKQLGKRSPKKNFFSHQMKLLILKMACILSSIWSNSSHKTHK